MKAPSCMIRKVSVVLPTLNEKGNIGPLIDAIHKELNGFDHEIIVVDDNSTDCTYEAVCDLRYPFVKAIHRKEDPSYGKSFRCGLESAEGEIFVLMGSDFNHHPKYLPFMLKAIDYYDCAMGSRFLYGGKGVGPSRHLLSWAFNLFLRLITDGRITDNLFGYIVIRKEVIEQLNYDDIFWGFGEFSIRLLYYLQREGGTVLQVPMTVGERLAGVGNRRFIRNFIKYTLATVTLVFKEGRCLKP